MQSTPGARELPAPFKHKVLNIARQVSATVGAQAFRAITTHLAGALEADCVWIGEFVPGPVHRVRTLAAFPEDEPAGITFDLAGSACSRIAARGKPFICRKDTQKHFPDDPILRKVGAQSCVAIPLMNGAHSPAGVMMAIYRTPNAGLHNSCHPGDLRSAGILPPAT